MYFSMVPMVTVPCPDCFDHAITFAQTVLRADTAADLGKSVGGLAGLIGLLPSVLFAVRRSQSGMLLCNGQ